MPLPPTTPSDRGWPSADRQLRAAYRRFGDAFRHAAERVWQGVFDAAIKSPLNWTPSTGVRPSRMTPTPSMLVNDRRRSITSRA